MSRSATAGLDAVRPSRAASRPPQDDGQQAQTLSVLAPRFAREGSYESSETLSRCAESKTASLKFPLDWQEAKKGKRNADRRWVTTSAPFYRRGGAPLSLSPRPLARERGGGGTPAYRRSTAALARGTLVPKAQLQARLPGTWFPRVLPAVSCPSPVEAPHTPAIVPASMMPGAARERNVSFRARAPHPLHLREYLREGDYLPLDNYPAAWQYPPTLRFKR
jgi:hypothetical protein